MASNFNDPLPPLPSAAADGAETGTPGAATQTTEPPASPGLARFRSCRWYQPAEGGAAEFCTHREVKPYAGTSSFDADAWCPDCTHYKLRRVPKKRQPTDEYSY